MDAVLSFLALVLMEIALGIDNVVFVSILINKLPAEMQKRARRIWMLAGIGIRVVLLYAIFLLIDVLHATLFTLDLGTFTHAVSGKHIIMFVGGIFLIAKATLEIHEKLESPDHESKTGPKGTFFKIMTQVLVIDLVFSLDSIITAVGLAGENLWIMLSSVVLAMAGMFFFARPIGVFVFKHPTLKVLALAFLLLIGIVLVADGLGQHISKAYIYFAMAFSLGVEVLNLQIARRRKPLELNMPVLQEESGGH